jgi:iron complex transport system ATP-binding protein
MRWQHARLPFAGGDPAPDEPMTECPAVVARGAVLVAPTGTTILEGIDWEVGGSDRWVIIGANGSGKTSLLRLAAAQTRPTSGTVDVLGERLGRTDMRELRRRIGMASVAVTDQLRPGLSAHDAVVTARHGALEPWWHDYDPADHARADELLATMGCAPLRDRPIATLSQGERQRVVLARALMPRPGLLLLDEPAAGLDLPAREALVDRLSDLAGDGEAPPMVLVTHHVEEIPPGITHALLLRGGRVVAAGPVDEAMTPPLLSDTFGIDVRLARRDGRWTAWSSRAP